MVVNVITRHAPTNYGSLLQAIATQRVIMNLGYETRRLDGLSASTIPVHWE